MKSLYLQRQSFEKYGCITNIFFSKNNSFLTFFKLEKKLFIQYIKLYGIKYNIVSHKNIKKNNFNTFYKILTKKILIINIFLSRLVVL